MYHRTGPANDGELLVLAATVAAADRTGIERLLKDAGFEVRIVFCAEEAEVEIDGHTGRCVLVIDGGLLNMPHDGCWRNVRARSPGLGTIVRCWIARDPGIEYHDDHMILVHPDGSEQLLEAMRSFRVDARG